VLTLQVALGVIVGQFVGGVLAGCVSVWQRRRHDAEMNSKLEEFIERHMQRVERRAGREAN